IAWATEKDVGAITSNIIRAGILASTLSLDWYQPVQAEKFESMVIDYLYHTELRDALSLRENVYGLSGHQITVPVTIKTDIPKYVFTSSVKHGGSWNSAYSLLGKLIDLKASSEEYNNRFVVIDSEAIGDQMQQLSLLFHESSQVLPFSKRETWIKRLAA
ncbi:hypothetical protein ABUO98_004980, partial [Escherichia coli]